MAEPNCVAVIMAGGSGTRFWPKSQKSFPKQYLPLFSSRTLIQETRDRIAPLVSKEGIYVCTGKAQEDLVQKHLTPVPRLILEPSARNTAPCLLLSAQHLIREGHDPDTVMIVLPADHHIQDEPGFRLLLQQATDVARRLGGLVTVGIAPTHPHTGYGYIEGGKEIEPGVRPIQRFLEKPNRDRAEEFLKTGGFYWNGGIFVWTLRAIAAAFAQYLPTEWDLIQKAETAQDVEKIYPLLSSIPIDTAVLEKATNGLVLPASIGWSDIGSWGALYDLLKDSPSAHVVKNGQVASIASQGCLVDVQPGKKIALVGVENLVVVETEDAILIAARSEDQRVRDAAKTFES